MPTSRKICDDGGDAASQIDSDGGTMLGQMPSTSPAKPSTKKHRVSTNGDASRPSCIAARHSANAFTNASSGTGASHQKFPLSNQRAMIRESRNGSHALTSPMNATTTSTSGRARVRAVRCVGPSVFRISQHRSEEHTSELQSLMRISYAVFCLKKNKNTQR